jgi:hypothetical protein
MKKMNLIATAVTVAAITFAGAAAALELGLSLGVDGFVDEQGDGYALGDGWGDSVETQALAERLVDTEIGAELVQTLAGEECVNCEDNFLRGTLKAKSIQRTGSSSIVESNGGPAEALTEGRQQDFMEGGLNIFGTINP